MSDQASKKNYITLQASDGVLFEIDEAVAREFDTIKHYIDDGGVSKNTILPLPNVSSAPLLKIIDLCKTYIQFRAKESNLPPGSSTAFVVNEMDGLDQELVIGESIKELVELVMAADFLNAKDLLNFLNQTVADRIQNKSVEYVRNLFGIENDYTPEEEAELRLEYAWAFEGVDED